MLVPYVAAQAVGCVLLAIAMCGEQAGGDPNPRVHGALGLTGSRSGVSHNSGHCR